jgi:hypothetical protein
MAFEKIAGKELSRDKGVYGDKEAFVTASYLELMKAGKKLENEEKQKEAQEAEHLVEGKSDRFDIYRNLLKDDMGSHRPDLTKVVVQKPKPPMPQPTAKPPTKEGKAPERTGRPDSPKERQENKERSRSRSAERREKKAEAAPEVTEKPPVVEEPEKVVEVSRDEKRRLALERLAQRKQQQTTAPASEEGQNKQT